jgi:IS30 family transposase
MGVGQYGRRGVALTNVRRAFERLIAQSVSISEACRVVGINRRTGTRWRYGRDIPAAGGRTLHYAPVVTTRRTRPISARFLSEDERITISDRRRAGATVWAIAVELGRSRSSTPMTRRDSWSPNRSTKLSTTRAAAWSATAPACRCAPVVAAVVHTGAQMLAAAVAWSR